MAYESTDVAVSKSQDQIRKLIYAHKGTGLMLLSQPPREGFEGMIELAETPYHIRIMATCKTVSRTRKQGWGQKTEVQYAADVDQENRRVWRVLYWHLKAMFEAADSGVIDIRDVIMPYVVLRDGMTLADHIKPQMKNLMNLDPARLLGAGGQQGEPQ